MDNCVCEKHKRVCIVGAGGRGFGMFVQGLKEDLGDYVQFVGVYDINHKRSEFYRENIGDGIHVYNDFDVMLDTEHPDAVIVTTVDCFHHEYIIRALDKGYNVFSEKPITNTYERCLAIREAERRNNCHVTTTFNCRFMNYFATVKELVASGAIGRILSFNYLHCTDRRHGGDYFKRWHRFMQNSQGLLLHKSTHHFDIANWIIDDEPYMVTALGNRVYYGDESKSHAKRCTECAYADRCESALAKSELDRKLYYDAEDVDGYIRDHCSFLPDTDINDNLSVSVMYRHGALLTYSLNFFSEHEGFRIEINGEKGTLIYDRLTPVAGGDIQGDFITLLYPNHEIKTVPVRVADGPHDGGDAGLRKRLFSDQPFDDPLGQCADSYAGVLSAMVGIAANESMATGKAVCLEHYLETLK